MKSRIKKLSSAAIIIIAAGLLYYLINRLTGFAIPCPINFVTGLHCPGCGISRMFIALLSLDFQTAFKSNAAIMCALPLILLLAVSMVVCYIKKGTAIAYKWQNTLVIAFIVYFVAFGVLRNIPYFSFLAP